MQQGFMYLTAVIDWYSRYVLSWRLSNTLDGRFCLEALEEALRGGTAGDLQHRSGGRSSRRRSFTGRLEEAGVAVSMDGRGQGVGQRVRGAAVAVVEIRGGVPEGLPERGGVGVGADELVPVLQPREAASGPEVSCPSGRRAKSDPSGAGLGGWTAGVEGFSVALGECRARAGRSGSR